MRHLERALSLALLLGFSTVSSTPAEVLALQGVTVIDVEAGAAEPGLTVVVSGDRITSVAEAGAVEIPDDSVVIDAQGQFLIPGLWDMHVHSWNDQLMRNVFYPLFVLNGVTGVREMSGEAAHLQLRKEIADGTAMGPRLVVGGLADAPHGGFGMPFVAAKTHAEGRAAVDSIQASGFDFVKTYSFLPAEAYRGVMERAREVGLEVSGHVPIAVGLEEALDLGQRTLEHLAGVEFACSNRQDRLRRGYRREIAALAEGSNAGGHEELFVRSEWEPLEFIEPGRCRGIYRLIADAEVWVVPTLIRQDLVSHRQEASILQDPRGQALAGFLDPKQVWGMDPKRQLLPVYEHRVRSIGALHAAGVGILAGSDLPGGLPLHYELQLLVEGGLSPLEALRTATIHPARYLQKTDSLGTIEPGKLADLVLLDANPLEDIANTERIAAVVLGGRFIDRDGLDKILDRVLTSLK